MLKPGDIAFFKRAKDTSSSDGKFVEFQGHGFGILLGHVPNSEKDPAREHIFCLLGAIGFLKFDDVHEFLGEEAAALCVQKFNEKYYPAKPETPVIDALLRQPCQLVDIKGNPI